MNALPIRVLSLVDWIISNRGNNPKTFGYDEGTLMDEIIESTKNMTMAYSVDDEYKINGVVCGHLIEQEKQFFVDDILTTQKGVVGKLLNVFRKLYPNYVIVGKTRTGRIRIFTDTEKLRRRMM